MAEAKNHRNYRSRYICTALCYSLTALLPANNNLTAEKRESLINIADKALWEMNYPKADSLYTSELQKNPENVELYWKLARLQVSIGESINAENSDLRLQHYRKAEEYARAGISLDSTNAKGHTWLAASLGMRADKMSTKNKLKQAGEIKKELDTALRLNPNDETALSMLGSYYREAANIGWFKRMVANTFIGEVPVGNYDLAEKAFRKAISLDSRIIRNYHELALIDIEKERKEEAILLMKTALDKPILTSSDRKRIEEMRLLLKKLSR